MFPIPIQVRDIIDLAQIGSGIDVWLPAGVCFDPLVCSTAGRVPKVKQTFGIFVSVCVGERGGSSEAGYTAGDEVLLVDGEVITGFGRVAAFPDRAFSSSSILLVDLERARAKEVTYHVQTGNL